MFSNILEKKQTLFNDNKITLLTINNIKLHNYRSHHHFELNSDNKSVVITGKNGTGKTSILEAISLLSVGKGLRNAHIDEYLNKFYKNSHWKITSIINCIHGKLELSTVKHEKFNKRIININEQKISNNAELSKFFSVIWLTPLMDQIFIGPSQNRRKFLDKMAVNFDDYHSTRINQYEKLMKERAILLKKTSSKANDLWLSSIEKNMSQIATTIAVSRVQTIEYLQAIINNYDKNFPKADISIKGELEELVHDKPSIQIENEFASKLANLRSLDLISGRTNAGIHRSDLIVYHQENKIKASQCSTGEQKALLLTIILAKVEARIKWKSSTPIVLLDEVVAHLDNNKRNLLFEKLLSMKVQFWLTGTDSEIFRKIDNAVKFISL